MFENVNQEQKLQIFSPRINTFEIVGSDGKNYSQVSINKLSVFDSLLHGRQSFASLGRTLNTIPPINNTNKTSFLLQMSRDKNIIDAAKELSRSLRKDRIELLLSTGDSIIMHLFRYQRNYVPIAFFGNTLKQTVEFLMTPFIWPGSTLNSEMIYVKAKEILGPKTVQMLVDMGYATEENQQMLELVILD